MKAIVCTKYGAPDVLQLKEVEKPIPKDNEALIKIHATSLNAADFEYLRGMYQITLGGLRKPKNKIIGSDIAGRVESTGREVKQFQSGDDIFADLYKFGFGAFAEYVCVPENALRLKPASMTFEEAATLPQAALIALQGLRYKRQIQPGQNVLINGASGGVGTFAVQIAKSFEVEVTGVASTRKLDMVRSIGADYVIDYTQEDFTKSGKKYDLILDVAAHHSIFDYKRALSPKGIYALIGGAWRTIIQVFFLGPLISTFGSKKMGIMVWKPNKKEDMLFIGELFEAGKLVPIIDRCYPLSEVAEALRYLEEGHAQGKVVITVEHNDKT
ncbi:MAG: NAD(P)-dependent alcohol dehydrogenase [Promethearchaeota archaeon]|jgi:NADPH:quinone reductase-like Zn-dependent oxidoreductase